MAEAEPTSPSLAFHELLFSGRKQPHADNDVLEASHCKNCAKPFGYFKKKKQCFYCGECVCKPCTQKGRFQPFAEHSDNESRGIKLCKKCFQVLKEKSEEKTLPTYAPSFANILSGPLFQNSIFTVAQAEVSDEHMENGKHIRYNRIRYARKNLRNTASRFQFRQIYLEAGVARKILSSLVPNISGYYSCPVEMEPYRGVRIPQEHEIVMVNDVKFNPCVFMDEDLASVSESHDALTFSVKPSGKGAIIQKKIPSDICKGLSSLCEFKGGRPVMKCDAASLKIGDELRNAQKSERSVPIELYYTLDHMIERSLGHLRSREMVSMMVKSNAIEDGEINFEDFADIFSEIPVKHAFHHDVKDSPSAELFHILSDDSAYVTQEAWRSFFREFGLTSKKASKLYNLLMIKSQEVAMTESELKVLFQAKWGGWIARIVQDLRSALCNTRMKLLLQKAVREKHREEQHASKTRTF